MLTGSCSGDFKQFYYHPQYDSCFEFRYSGCEGNGNRFDTLPLCEERCKRNREPEITTVATYEPEPDREREPEPDREPEQVEQDYTGGEFRFEY